MSNTIQSLRGMKDLTGAESELFIYFIKNASNVYLFFYLLN